MWDFLSNGNIYTLTPTLSYYAGGHCLNVVVQSKLKNQSKGIFGGKRPRKDFNQIGPVQEAVIYNRGMRDHPAEMR